MSFITGKHLARRTLPARRGRDRGPPVPGCDGSRRPYLRQGAGGRAHAAAVHRRGARPGRLQQPGGGQVPVRARDSGARLHADRRQPALDPRGLPRLPDGRQQHRRPDGRGLHGAGDRRRPLPLERGVPHAERIRSRRRARTSGPAPRWISSTRSASARTRRCRRCSSASRTWTRPAAAPTTTRAPTPTRSAGRRPTSRCR